MGDLLDLYCKVRGGNFCHWNDKVIAKDQMFNQLEADATGQ
jgi:hypothetical protein